VAYGSLAYMRTLRAFDACPAPLLPVMPFSRAVRAVMSMALAWMLEERSQGILCRIMLHAHDKQNARHG
jgi:hypothetical protein